MQRILIVDDERLVADTLSLVFQKSGFEVDTAYSADEAMDLARGEAPDLLLCDVTMPGKNGLILTEQMCREFPACRILFLTGFTSNLDPIHEQTRALAKPVGILTKPCRPEEVLREAHALLMTG